jgi:hypothetical protein
VFKKPTNRCDQLEMSDDMNAFDDVNFQSDADANMGQALVGYSDPDMTIRKAFEAMSRMDRAAFCRDIALKAKTHGYVYVAWNSSFPTLVKIGATSRQNPFIRLKELSTSGVPGRFELVCCMATLNPFQQEKQVHAHFKQRRSFGFRKEFFEVSVEEVVEYFDMLIGENPPATAAVELPGRNDRSDANELYRNFTTSLDIGGNRTVIRAVSTCTEQILFSCMDIASVLTGEIDTKRLAGFLRNVEMKISRWTKNRERTSLEKCRNPFGKDMHMGALKDALVRLKVCVGLLICLL